MDSQEMQTKFVVMQTSPDTEKKLAISLSLTKKRTRKTEELALHDSTINATT